MGCALAAAMAGVCSANHVSRGLNRTVNSTKGKPESSFSILNQKTIDHKPAGEPFALLLFWAQWVFKEQGTYYFVSRHRHLEDAAIIRHNILRLPRGFPRTCYIQINSHTHHQAIFPPSMWEKICNQSSKQIRRLRVRRTGI